MTKLPEPYHSIVPYDEKLTGFFDFCPTASRGFLQQFTIGLPTKGIVVEVGSGLGESAITIAKAMNKTQRLYCIDPWQVFVGSYEQPQADPYRAFLSNVIHEECADRIVPIRADSMSGFSMFKHKAHFIYIDGSHAYQDVRNDIMAWQQKLVRPGVLCGDDYFMDEVKQAVLDSCKEMGMPEPHTTGIFWYMYFGGD